MILLHLWISILNFKFNIYISLHSCRNYSYLMYLKVQPVILQNDSWCIESHSLPGEPIQIWTGITVIWAKTSSAVHLTTFATKWSAETSRCVLRFHFCQYVPPLLLSKWTIATKACSHMTYQYHSDWTENLCTFFCIYMQISVHRD